VIGGQDQIIGTIFQDLVRHKYDSVVHDGSGMLIAYLHIKYNCEEPDRAKGRRGWIDGLHGKRKRGWRHGVRAEAEFDTFSFSLFCSGGLIPPASRTAHAEGGGSLLLWRRPRAEAGFLFPFVLSVVMYGGSTFPFGMNGPHQKRETIK